jgi:hypothetical protein
MPYNITICHVTFTNEKSTLQKIHETHQKTDQKMRNGRNGKIQKSYNSKYNTYK